MKVLLVIAGLGMGGAEHIVVNLADELVKLGHTVKIAYLTGSILVSPKSSEVELVAIGAISAKNFFKAYFKLRNLVKSFKPDVVHSHMFHSNILSRLVRLTTRVPKLISTVHNTYEGGVFRMLAYRLTDKLADISTNVSEQAVNEFVRKGAVKSGRMVTISNGIDTNKFNFSSNARNKIRRELAVGDESMLLLSVGRLHIQKDYQNLLNAAALLKELRQDFKVFIVGDGLLRDSIYSLIKELNLESFVELLGMRSDVPSLMSAADVFVLSSAWEGFGLVVAEAMSCQRVVVATDCGGVAEVVGIHGFLVEPKNHIELAKELNKVLNMSKDNFFEIGSAARQHIIENYPLEYNVESYFKLYTA